jgi:parvulin-like peptidyl-prolyl isomerase
VNGEAISIASYERSLALYQAAQAETGTLLASEHLEQIVLDDLIARLLLAQAAREAGFTADESLVTERLTTLVEEAGGQTALNDWMAANGYTPEAFEQDLALEIEAAWMRDEITNAVPTSAEQVEARQILLSDDFAAERLLGQLEGGASFETLVANNDPQRLGYLGWFPRGYLLQPEVEEAAFALQPGEYSQVVETEIGFHLIEVLERDPDRSLSPQARLALQIQALEDWLAERRAQSDIQVFLP